MKKIILLVFVIVLLGFIAYKLFFTKQPYVPPKKPAAVPANAIWSGERDGGNWIELVEIKENKYRFRIYLDYDGSLLMDADFEMQNCQSYQLTESNWKESVCCYTHASDESVTLNIENAADKKCYLKAIYPAYEGYDWEIIKNKYQK